MRILLAELGIIPAEDVQRVISAAWILHSRRPEEARQRPVSAWTLLAATALDDRVMGVLADNGLNSEFWSETLRPRPFTGQSVADYAVDPDIVRALEVYRKEFGARPLDAPAVAASLLRIISPKLRAPLEEAGLNIDLAVTALRHLIAPVEDGLVPVEQIESFALSPTARRLVASARDLGSRYRAPLTTSSLILAILMTAGGDDTLLGAMRRKIAGDTAEDELQKRVTEWMLWYRAYAPRSQFATLTTAEAFARAIELARRSSGKAVAHARHVLAALLTVPEENPGVADVLRWMGRSAQPLRQALMSIVEGLVRAGTIIDDLDVWREFLLGETRGSGPAHTLATINNEDLQGTDLLGIERDVKSFATLLASNTFTPPLSVGLFGNWGSGKSFFMERLQKEIAALASEAAGAGFATRFHTRIVQIKFNAWHYVEGNLWASLVEHIFRNLKLSEHEEPSVTDERRAFFLGKLDEAVAKETAAKVTIAAATAQSEELTKRIAAESKASESATAHLLETTKLALRDLVQLDPGQREAVRVAVADLGLENARAAAGEAADGLDALRAAGGEVRQVVRWAVHGPGAVTRLLLFAAALFGGALLAAGAAYLATTQWARTLAWIVPFLATLGAWAAAIAKAAKPVLEKVERARKVVSTAYDKAESARQEQIAALEKQQKDAAASLEAARAQLEEADRIRAAAQKELAHLGEDRKLVRFIDNRLASDDYRKFLGVLAVVRSDFETLSRLMSDSAVAAAAGPHRIDRIVLYIDDLDRCPPRFVRDVLQAVHLLLAFKLFVVVVGVDARWVSRSLEREYHDQLRPETAPGTSSPVAGYGATAYDYLEKIFQVPFWIEPLSEEATRSLLSGMVNVRTREKGVHVQPEDRVPTPGPRAEPPPIVPTEPVVPVSTTPKTEPAAPRPGDHRLFPAALLLEEAELRSMHALAPLVGRSPRSVKRFANVYRILRAAKTPAELARFVGDGNAPGEYGFVLLLLAIITGAPTVSTEVFRYVAHADGEELLPALAERIRTSPPSGDGEAGEWIRACDAIGATGVRLTGSKAADLQPHLRAVSRFSFREPVL
jgi:hypothetical protein